jgi:chromosomal replication initiator protein
MVRRALCKIIKVALTKELAKTLSYFIKLRWKILMATNNRSRNNCQVNRAPMKSQNIDAPYKNLDPELKSFCNSGIRNLKLNHN